MTKTDPIYHGSDGQQVLHVCSCPSHFLGYFRPTSFVVSLLHRISLLKPGLSAADPRDMKAPRTHLTSQRDQNHWCARLDLTPPNPNTHQSIQPQLLEYIYIYESHVACACTHVNQMSTANASTQATSQVSLSLFLPLSLFHVPLSLSVCLLILHS